MESLKYDRFLDLKGLECPFPVVKSREEIARMAVGQVLRIIATDNDSLRNFQGWANTAKNIVLIAQAIASEDGKPLFTHYIRKIS
jgi:tRNA 2-thiouridine synthesizing protein A